MRKHGRLMKNIAGLLLLLALLSLLLPFCKFNAGDGNMTLSGIEVIKTGGKAGYTYFKEGRLSENYVIKAPYTWGDIRDSVSYINHAGGANILVFCAVAIAVPLVLCFLSMFMLFMAEGKKTMFMPTLFTLVVVAEMLLIVFGITPLRPFLKIGVYLFTILNVIALLFIIAGWITGGYRQPDKRQSRYGYGGKGDTSKDGVDGDNNRSHRRKRRKTRRKTKKKKKTKKDKSSDDDNKKENNEDSENKEKKVSGEPVTGVISNGSGIYHGLSWNLKDGKDVAMVTLGDVSVYSTCTYVHNAVKNAGFELEIVPGITSFCAAADKAQISLCEGNESVAIIPSLKSNLLEKYIADFDTVVIMKSGNDTDVIYDILKKYGLENNAIVSSCIGMENEIIEKIQKGKSYGYFTTVIVRK